MAQFSIKLLVFLLICTGLLQLLDSYYTKYTINHKNVCEKADWILNHHNQSYDIAFIGNSRVINMIDIDSVEAKTNKKAINLGLIGANYAENLLVLNQFLKAGNLIKNLLIQVDMHSLRSTTLPYPFHNYNYMYLFNDTTVNRIYKDNNPSYKYYIWKYIPFARYMEFSNRFVLYKILKGGYECKTSDVLDPTKGTEFLSPKEFNTQKEVFEYCYIRDADKKYLLELITFSKQKNINVMFYTAPIYSKHIPYQLRLNDILQKTKMIAQENNIPYFNFSQNNILCNEISNFNDNIHMNTKGAGLFSSVIAESMKEHLN